MKRPMSWRTATAWASIWLGAAMLWSCGAETSPERSAAVAGGEFEVIEWLPAPTLPPQTTTTTTGESTTTSAANEPAGSPCGQLTLPTTLFETSSASLSPGIAERLLEILDDQLDGTCLDNDGRACPSRSIRAEVVGHTDSRPRSAPGGNQELSEQRAQAVADVLAQREIETDVSGVADREPVSATDDQKNRRVVVTVTCQD